MAVSPFLSQNRIDAMTKAGFWKNRTLLDYFDQHVLNRPDNIAVVDHKSETGLKTTLTYQQLSQYVDRIALGLIDLGVKPGDVIASQLPNWWEFLALYLASVRVGAAINPLMPIYRHREVSYMMGFAEAKVAVVAESFRGFNYPNMMEEISSQLPSLEHVLTIGGQENPGSFEEKLLSPRWEENPDRLAIFEQCKLDPNSVTQLLFTSGTTGNPKGVMQISNTLLACTENFVKRYSLSENDNIMMSSPLAHQTGFLVGVLIPIYLGSKAVYQDVWDADRAIQIVHDEQVHFTMASTPFLSDMTSAPALAHTDTTHFKTFVTGGAPIPRVVAEDARKKLHCEVYGVYGMSENLAVTVCGPGDSEEKIFGTDGVAQPGVELRIVDENGNELPRGEEGEIQTRGSYNFCGYLKQEELTAAAIDEDGWFSTGDLARMDDDGFIRITGRSKDILIRGGENVPIVEVENLIYKHPSIQDAALVGVPDPRLGERGCLFVTLRAGTNFSLDAMKLYLGESQMAKQYWPEQLEIVEELPKTLSGKIQKFKLRDEAEQLEKTRSAE